MPITQKFDLKDRMLPFIIAASDPKVPIRMDEWKSIPYLEVVDSLDHQVGELIKALTPQRIFKEEELEQEIQSFFQNTDRDSYGNWVYYPWKNIVTRLLPEEDFIRVRTQRNNYKITHEEQAILREKKVGIIGLSVGQSIALVMALERSCGEMRLADFDHLELSNLNRIKAGVPDLGRAKTVIAAREISEIDPYLKLTIYEDGITEDNIDSFLTADGQLDLLVDECDSLDVKILARERAKHFGIPVMMETSDRGMVDVERFDVEPEREILHGYLEGVSRKELSGLTNPQKVGVGLKITGVETLSPRMKASLLEIGETISTWPQLASAVFLGGATIAHIGRRVLLNESVKSGRFYVDLDEIIALHENSDLEIDSSDSPKSADPRHNLPRNVLPSSYFLTEQELYDLLEKANTAPSGGNVQPWIWVFDSKGVLHLFHDKVRSHSMLDFNGSGSLIAFGAALENLRLASAKAGIELEIIQQIKEFDEDLIASVRFIGKQKLPIKTPYEELVDAIELRNTNRKNTKKQFLPKDVLKVYSEMAEEEGLFLDFKEQEEDLNKLSKVIGEMDRLRLFHEQGLKDFVHEVRWSEKEAKETLDGIDIATLELSAAERAAMGLLKDPRTIRFFKKFLMGYGLTKISHQTLMTSSALFLLRGLKYDPDTFLKAGRVLQRIWLKANLDGYSFQPVTACLFIFHRVEKIKDHGFTETEAESIKDLKKSLNSIFDSENEKNELFMFRVNDAGQPSIRAYRRKVTDSLIVL
ncbi:Rv1355c family protein [Algoriphagus sediminis]|uniref:Rv1355c family protein n=1 Tax=Algoriphagus sediminis TaxID=3057113 RepID=A0ABT7Y9I9_9BACT|nr:Rv1355c family protein [Algoriphagus sediminis]MDN3203170.1 Rv1355c family protein [Algoriphagus sediminis]